MADCIVSLSNHLGGQRQSCTHNYLDIQNSSDQQDGCVVGGVGSHGAGSGAREVGGAHQGGAHDTRWGGQEDPGPDEDSGGGGQG